MQLIQRYSKGPEKGHRFVVRMSNDDDDGGGDADRDHMDTASIDSWKWDRVRRKAEGIPQIALIQHNELQNDEVKIFFRGLQ